MKKLSILVVLLSCCLFLNGFISVAPVADNAAPSLDEVKAARFENLLNINTVYGEDFLDNQKLVNAALVVLKGYADDEGFIENAIVSAYIKDMYDINLDINEKINEGLPQKEGYVLLIPRGHSVYNHTVTAIEENENFVLVTSNVVVTTHEGDVLNLTAETKFIENENSSFGYSIIDSVLFEKAVGLKI